MAPLDLQAVLGRLLTDGHFRDAFCEDRESVARRLNVAIDDRVCLLTLASEELEMQADILLHKRFERVQMMLPDVCRFLAEETWPLFRRYGRYQWVKPGDTGKDAFGFCEYLVARRVVSRGISELNRVIFVGDARRLEVRFVRDAFVAGRKSPGLQFLVRLRGGEIREFAVGVAL